MIHLRPGPKQHDPRLYSPQRDIAHTFPFMFRVIARRMNADCLYEPMKKLCEARGVDKADIAQATVSLVHFLRSAAERPGEEMEALLDRCGFLDTPPEAQATIVAEIGLITLGSYFTGVREASLGDADPASACYGLESEVRRFYKLFHLPRWRRRLVIFRSRVRAAWRALWKYS